MALPLHFDRFGPASEADVARLVPRRGVALVTITLDTDPGRRLDVTHAARLEQLVAEARRRVLEEPGSTGPPAWTGPDLTAALRSFVMGSGLAVLAGPDGVEAFRLSHPPGDRVVVDPTFATRSLVRDVWESPELALLVLSSNEARLFVADRDGVVPAGGSDFPMRAEASSARAERSRHGRRQRLADSTVWRFLRRVDSALWAAAQGRPVVVLAAEPVASHMRAVASRPLLGVVPGHRLRATPAELAAAVEPLRAAHVGHARTVGLGRAESARNPRRRVTGVDDVWRVASRGAVELLLVDRDFRCAGAPDGDDLRPAPDPTEPGVIDDVVDDLIEAVTIRGGSICFVEPGDLGGEGVQAIVRR